jgi:uncharacterized protein YuzE
MQYIHLTYDDEGDILHIAFRENRQASTLSLHDNLLLRYDSQTGEAVGLTMIGFSDLLDLERRGQSLPLRNLTELPSSLAQLITNVLGQPPVSFYLQWDEARHHLITRLGREFSLAELLLAA